MAGEIFEKFYDPDDRENSWADTEPKNKSVKDIQAIISDGITTKDELDMIEESLKYWNDGDIKPEIFDIQ
jgi:hypothetical protein